MRTFEYGGDGGKRECGRREAFRDLTLSRDATFADFAEVLDGEFLDAFDAELEDILGSKGAEMIRDLLARCVGTERVRDVFAEYGLDEEAVAYYFFIRFGK